MPLKDLQTAFQGPFKIPRNGLAKTLRGLEKASKEALKGIDKNIKKAF